MKHSSIFKSKTWVVDHLGIRQENKQGLCVKKIDWQDLTDIDLYHVKSHNMKINFNLSSEKLLELTNYIEKEWEERYPEKYKINRKRNQERALNSIKKILFIILPSILIVPIILLLFFMIAVVIWGSIEYDRTILEVIRYFWEQAKEDPLFHKALMKLLKALNMLAIFTTVLWALYFFIKKNRNLTIKN